MTTPYDSYKHTEEWILTEKAVSNLIENQDIKLLTSLDYVVGYITKQLIENLNNNSEVRE